MKYDIDGHLHWAPMKKLGRGWIAFKDSAGGSPQAPSSQLGSQITAARTMAPSSGPGNGTTPNQFSNVANGFLGSQSGSGQNPYGYAPPAGVLNGGINDTMPMNNPPTALGSQLAAQYFGGNSGPAVPQTFNGAPVTQAPSSPSDDSTPPAGVMGAMGGMARPQFGQPQFPPMGGLQQAMASALRQGGPTQFGSPDQATQQPPQYHQPGAMAQRPQMPPPQYRPNPQSLPVYNPNGPRGR